ncbi:MAG: MalY/PatB family protein [Candidatus Bipolaricaulota bacterium]
MVDQFNQITDRKDTNSVKWDHREEVFGKEELLPMWVADADWPTAKPIVKGLKSRVNHGIFGYTRPGKEHDQAIISWLKKTQGLEVKSDWIVHGNGVVPSISIAIQAFAGKGKGVILQPPVYYPFYSTVENNDAEVVNNQLIYRDGIYEMDFSDLREKLSKRGKEIDLLVLCSPHNPVGRVWKREELSQLFTICHERKVIVISDEIHADFVFSNHSHTPFFSLGDETKNNSIILNSPSKTFNIAGLQTSYALIPNEKMREEFREAGGRLLKSGNLLGLEALKLAYTNSEKWFEKQHQTLRTNIEYATNYFEHRVPLINPVPLEGTYLLWLDCRRLKESVQDLNQFFVERAQVGLDPGEWFGPGGEGFMRLNVACPQSLLHRGLNRIKKAVEQIASQKQT